MRLHAVRIFNCFGFGDTTANLESPLIYILGRNSSGKTALLDAINSIAPDRTPDAHQRFENFRPTAENPRVRATFRDVTAPETIDVTAPIRSQLLARNIAAASSASFFAKSFATINEQYTALIHGMVANGTLTLTKFKGGGCQLTVGEEFDESTKRRQELDAILKRLAPGGILQIEQTRYENVALNLTANDLDREAARQLIPRITYYDKQYSLTDDLPDHLTTSDIERSPNSLTAGFLALLNADEVGTLLNTNDPDEQDQLRASVQERADALAKTISQDASRLVAITLSVTRNGLQITLRTDGKKSFYRQLSDATKFLIAYHIHARQHAPGAILLFDEPSRGLHASAEQYLREFLNRLAEDNQVVVSTHSDRLIDIRHLHNIRLMQQDDDDRPVVLNTLKPPRDRANYLLALQPIFDAIGLAYTNQTLTNKTTILTEGLTDYLYLRAFHDLAQVSPTYGIAPGRGESTFFTLIPFLASQDVSMKIILDDPALKEHLQEAYGIPESTFFFIPTSGTTRGIEDLFAPSDYIRLLHAVGDNATLHDLRFGNSTYAKQTNKRLVAENFRTTIAQYTLDTFDEATRDNITALLAFCSNEHWFTI